MGSKPSPAGTVRGWRDCPPSSRTSSTRRPAPKRRAARLRVACKSEPFPATVVAYRPGKIDDKRLRQFREGLMHSHETVLGRQLMLLWRMSAFQRVPADFDAQMAAILKSYPAPTEKK